jgi:cysteine dioxygenase
VLRRELEQLEISLEDVQTAVRFGPDTYRRNLLHAGPAYQALVLCWRAGQRSPIHDHEGSSCGVRVVRGVATETIFARNAAGLVYALRSCELRAGGVCASQDADVHQVSNLQDAGHDLVTLHIYSPPLLKMGVYSLTDASRRDFFEPVYASVAEGAGI